MEDSSHSPVRSDSLQARARQAARIVSHPERYKICEGCDSIIVVKSASCPNCYGYRFNEDRRDVVIQARLLGSREQTSVVAEDLF